MSFVKYLSAKKLAEITKKNRKTITSTAKNIPGSMMIDGRWYFPRSAIKHVLNRGPGAPKGNNNNPGGNPAWKDGYKKKSTES